MNKEKMVNELQHNHFLRNEPLENIRFFQHPKYFIMSSLFIENFNPNHKFIIWGFKKKKYHKNELKKYQKIALYIKSNFIVVVIALICYGLKLLCQYL